MREFLDDDDGYFSWLRENPNGFVLNARREVNPNYVVLHRAHCGSISSDKLALGAYTTRDYRKICATSIAELQRAAKQEGRVDGSCSKRCGLCQPLFTTPAINSPILERFRFNMGQFCFSIGGAIPRRTPA